MPGCICRSEACVLCCAVLFANTISLRKVRAHWKFADLRSHVPLSEARGPHGQVPGHWALQHLGLQVPVGLLEACDARRLTVCEALIGCNVLGF